MHRLTFVSLSFAVMLGCGGGKKDADHPGKGDTSSADGGGGETASGEKGDGGAGEGEGAPKKDECVGFDISNLDDLLMKSGCEVANAKPDTLSNAEVKGKLEVSVSASPTKGPPGAKFDLIVNFVNKTKEPMTLNFRIDPTPRFETEVWDAKFKKRIDMPAGSPPSAPKGFEPPPAAEQKVAKVTIAPNGAAHQRIPWEAVKMTWAPEKVRGTPIERGFPRKPNGPLPKGKYNIKVVTPLVGIMESGVDHEISAPKVEIEIGG